MSYHAHKQESFFEINGREVRGMCPEIVTDDDSSIMNWSKIRSSNRNFVEDQDRSMIWRSPMSVGRKTSRRFLTSTLS